MNGRVISRTGMIFPFIIFCMQELVSLASRYLALSISPQQADQFSRYRQMLLEWNEKFNLTAITDPREILIKHFYDSLTCLPLLPLESEFFLIDIGSGAGLPGIPVKILRPEISLTLVESAKKKTEFCSAVVETLSLQDVRVIHARAEEIGQDKRFRERMDGSVARAVSDLSVLAEYLLPLLRIGGRAICFKGRQNHQEEDEARPAIAKLGGELADIQRVELPNGYGQRIFYIIEKVGPTPPSYPRRPGVPLKKPIRN